ncbi:UDP-N-acetylmuramate dehydrogenase [candidate division KSB3 bacterium]|uniref:UDP-N-acetylenolpyruvoylglucosamine reductase n=1 Tax=candidate division KSB3 bacterium TaxID=2044937 RepID=A0A9D5JT07_9BACT|nr:UDP-N-acetylmuramate dehydrogenase [candidate division KSB3 bacterium]MBD3323678.1 UDP-N-acetylmuramate dehydrogenase [candidate division KSB3 bacterium]
MPISEWKHDLASHLQKTCAGDVLLDEPLARHTWYRIGGPADVFVSPKNSDDVINVLAYCRAYQIPCFLIGEGANLLVSDAGYRGVMVYLARYLNTITRQAQILDVQAGALLQEVVLTCERHHLGGMEYMAGIPGTVGGALIMNAGTDRGEIGDTVSEVSLLNEEYTQIVTMKRDAISFEYRNVPQLQDTIILGCKLLLHHEEESRLRARRLQQLQRRAATQPLEYPSCGSVFKRPPHHYVGKLVQDLGLKGYRCGDAMISDKHGGFIVNLGTATASQVKTLIDKIQAEVYQQFGIRLEPEVRFVGFDQ